GSSYDSYLRLAPQFFPHLTMPTEIFTLSLHDALPICRSLPGLSSTGFIAGSGATRAASAWTHWARPISAVVPSAAAQTIELFDIDRKSTRLNSSHVKISYAVFCLKKKMSIREMLKDMV